MAVKKNTSKQQIDKSTTRRSLGINNPETGAGLNDYFKLGESYTSLVLGIVVVIIASVLLVSLFKTRPNTRPDSQKGTSSISTVADVPVTLNPTILVTAIPTSTIAPSATPTPTAIVTPTLTPQPKVTSTPVPTQGVKPTVVPLVTQAPGEMPEGAETYTIKAGDDLWHIAESKYHDGYKWTIIAQVNKLDNPNVINVGNTLTLPPLTTAEKPQTQTGAPTATAPPANAITGTKYVIARGDDLWSVAVRAYGDGYRWVEIAEANKLSNPDLIHADNVLSIPRK